MAKNMAYTIHISAQSDPRLAEYLADAGLEIEYISTEGMVPAALSCHPDIFMCRLGSDTDAELIKYTETETVPGYEYPLDIPFNAACTGRYFIHNLRYTAPELLARAESLDMQLIDVKQGYAKCSTVVVDEDSIITYDRGLAKTCLAAGIDVLTVTAGHVVLPGYDTGFIGGASGRIGDTVYFNGDLTAHPDFESIVRFIEDRGLKVKWFEDWPLTDTGSII